MGSYFSLPRTQRILIGDLLTLPLEEQKLFDLSHFVLDKNDPYIGTRSDTLCTRLISAEGSSSDSKTSNASEANMQNAHASCSESVVSLDETGRTDSLIVVEDLATCSGVSNEEDVLESLFVLLNTNKPFYFSQTFSQYRTFYNYSIFWPPVCCRKEKQIIYLQPVDSFPDFISDFEIDMKSYHCAFDFFGLLKTFTEIFFSGMKVNLLPLVNNVQSRWKIKTRLHHKTNKKQYFVQNFYKALQMVKPPDGYCIMGISWTDLYPTEDLNFVLGEANFATKSGIFSFGRYEPKSFEPDTHEDIKEVNGKILWRVLKVLSHETCHLFGLQHCWYFQCAMNESSSMQEAASQPLFLCPVCLRKLQYSCGFSLVQRYRDLYRFLQDICRAYPTREFRRSVLWLEKCIEFLENG